jgi:hypothetical protein
MPVLVAAGGVVAICALAWFLGRALSRGDRMSRAYLQWLQERQGRES